ncbi:hypothetical protein NPIL_627701 [Nephila pilipes]|uniref:Uncharacterized protein n=1 Tax=Nephila pilipes TaxID=299642 RepID=A0A8X6MHX7_NEPPI|nr:hypothetical protein NPIL_627701 [Nephila pilipes]
MLLELIPLLVLTVEFNSIELFIFVALLVIFLFFFTLALIICRNCFRSSCCAGNRNSTGRVLFPGYRNPAFDDSNDVRSVLEKALFVLLSFNSKIIIIRISLQREQGSDGTLDMYSL